ncbi:hypothetical protein [uncultured Fibrella sp.]|uniref:hypothetical protein n=1 Tax=uncultured Fibrella sp. TaxID=1284596 RepID=UPI0035CB0996
MQVVRQPSVWFTPDEQALIRENPELVASLGDYINESETKPSDLNGFKWLLDNGYPTTPNTEIRANYLK